MWWTWTRSRLPNRWTVRPPPSLQLRNRYIRAGNPYRLLGLVSLLPLILCCSLAATWTPQTPFWVYYVTIFPSSLGYSIFLCVNLIALVSAVDSAIMPKATALLYTVRTLGVTLGVSMGGAVQLGSLASHLNKSFVSLLYLT